MGYKLITKTKNKWVPLTLHQLLVLSLLQQLEPSKLQQLEPSKLQHSKSFLPVSTASTQHHTKHHLLLPSLAQSGTVLMPTTLRQHGQDLSLLESSSSQ